MTNIVALAVVLAASVEVEVTARKPLRLARDGELKGTLAVKVTNRGTEPVTLQHRDVHGFRFTPASGEPVPQRIFHSCECGFEQGLQPAPASRTFTLAAGETKTLTFDDFTCGGGPFSAPSAGRYQVTYSLGEPEPPPRKADLDLKKCEAEVRARSPGPFESKPIAVQLKK